MASFSIRKNNNIKGNKQKSRGRKNETRDNINGQHKRTSYNLQRNLALDNKQLTSNKRHLILENILVSIRNKTQKHRRFADPKQTNKQQTTTQNHRFVDPKRVRFFFIFGRIITQLYNIVQCFIHKLY